jgi:hypothetical protein
MFFSIMLITRSKWGMMTVDMQFWSLRKSLNSWRYVCRSFFYLICLVSSLKSKGFEQACSFLRNWSLNKY